MEKSQVTWGVDADCLVVETAFTRKKGWEKRFLITSDLHVDSKKTDPNLIRHFLREAEEHDAHIIDNGDLFDCMGGKYDRRSNKADIRPEFQTDRYFDSIVDYAEKLLAPVAPRLIMLGDGNHEISVKDRHEIDILSNLADKLNLKHGGNVLRQKYTSYLRFVFRDGSKMESKIVYRTHGNGGNSPVTLGVISSARRQEQIIADAYVSGHIHESWEVPRTRYRIGQKNNIIVERVPHIQVGTAKDSTHSTWENMKGFRAPSLEMRWLIFWWNGRTETIEIRSEACY
jgi:hypothetical protein